MSKLEIMEYRGIRGLVAAELLTDDSEGITYGTPFPVVGLAELGKTTASSSATKYYDNVPALVIDSTGPDEVTIKGSAVPFDVLAKITGQVYDEALGMFIEGERESKYFAIGYITKRSDGTEIFVWRLKGKFSIPDESHKTENDGTDSEGQELKFTGVNTAHKFDKTGKTAKAINVDTKINKIAEDTFFAGVKTPDSIATA